MDWLRDCPFLDIVEVDDDPSTCLPSLKVNPQLKVGISRNKKKGANKIAPFRSLNTLLIIDVDQIIALTSRKD